MRVRRYPTYNKEALKGVSYVAFKKIHGEIDFYIELSEIEWIAEFEKATGKTYKVENDAEKVAVKKPIK
jgi:hypothetical protein